MNRHEKYAMQNATPMARYATQNATLMARYGATATLIHRVTGINEETCQEIVRQASSDTEHRTVYIGTQIDESAVAQAIEQAHKMHEASWVVTRPDTKFGPVGEYTLDDETCFMVTCERLRLPPHLWYVLSLANHWSNDLAAWSESVLVGGADADFNPPYEQSTESPCDEEADCAQSDALPAQSDGVPPHTLLGLIEYRDKGVPVGNFLYAVLVNDLYEAACRADDFNLPALRSIVQWVHDNMPPTSYGTKRRVSDWLRLKGARS